MASTVATSSFCKKTFGSESDATTLKNGVHLRKDLKVYFIHILKKHSLHEGIQSLLDFILAFLVLGIWNDLFEFVEWNDFDGLNAEEIMNK